MSIGVLSAFISEGVRSAVTVVTDNYELLCGCWEVNLGPLEGQLALSPAPVAGLSNTLRLEDPPLPKS